MWVNLPTRAFSSYLIISAVTDSNCCQSLLPPISPYTQRKWEHNYQPARRNEKRYLLALLKLQAFECEAHRALTIVSPAAVFVLLNDQLLGQVQERVVHIRAVLCARFDHGDAWVRLLELLNFFIRHLNLSFVIHFIGKDHNFDVRARMLFDFIEPNGDR